MVGAVEGMQAYCVWRQWLVLLPVIVPCGHLTRVSAPATAKQQSIEKPLHTKPLPASYAVTHPLATSCWIPATAQSTKVNKHKDVPHLPVCDKKELMQHKCYEWRASQAGH
jgi:hypothetical protein